MLPKKIVCIGASSCEGKVDVEGQGFVGRLRKWRETENQHNSVYNLGISGDMTHQVIARLKTEIPPRKPDLIIVQCGINDFIRDGGRDKPTRCTVEQVEANIRTIIQDAKKTCEVLYVSVYPIDEEKTTPCDWMDIYYQADDARQCADISKNVTAEMNIPYVDVYNTFIKEDYKKLLHTDGLHANSFGHQRIFEMIRDKLLKMYA